MKKRVRVAMVLMANTLGGIFIYSLIRVLVWAWTTDEVSLEGRVQAYTIRAMSFGFALFLAITAVVFGVAALWNWTKEDKP